MVVGQQGIPKLILELTQGWHKRVLRIRGSLGNEGFSGLLKGTEMLWVPKSNTVFTGV